VPSVLHDSQLTRDQRAVVELRTERHHLVMGPPGSGKTQVLLHRARWLRQTYKIPPEGFYVLVYTNVLTYFLRQSLEFLGIPKENVRTFDDWCADLWDQFVKQPKPRTAPDRRKKTFIDFPAVRAGVLRSLQAKASSGASQGQTIPMLAFVLVDEGQDLDATAFGILSLTAKHLTVFADARQQIFEGGASVLEMQKHLSLTGQTASLLAAHRNSPDIAKLASYFGSAYEGINYLAMERQKPCLYVANGWDDEMDHLADVLRERRLLNHRCGIIVPTNRDLFSVTTKLGERGVEVHKAIAIRRGGTPPDFDSLTPTIASYHNAKGLTFDCVLMPKLVENNFQRVEGERRHRLLLVGITRATQWVYLSTVRGWEVREMNIFHQAAANGDLFIKESSNTAPASATPTAAPPGEDDNDASFL
jgi:superfamily I DNA/RNA helicase